MQNKEEVFHLHGFKLKHILLDEFSYAITSLLALFVAILFHELGHYLAALYYGLNPIFGVNISHIYVKTNFLDLRTHEVVSHAGPIFNLLIAFLALILLYIHGHKCSTHDYICKLLFLIQVTNILVALFSLILFPFSGIL